MALRRVTLPLGVRPNQRAAGRDQRLDALAIRARPQRSCDVSRRCLGFGQGPTTSAAQKPPRVSVSVLTATSQPAAMRPCAESRRRPSNSNWVASEPPSGRLKRFDGGDWSAPRSMSAIHVPHAVWERVFRALVVLETLPVVPMLLLWTSPYRPLALT